MAAAQLPQAQPTGPRPSPAVLALVRALARLAAAEDGRAAPTLTEAARDRR